MNSTETTYNDVVRRRPQMTLFLGAQIDEALSSPPWTALFASVAEYLAAALTASGGDRG